MSAELIAAILTIAAGLLREVLGDYFSARKKVELERAEETFKAERAAREAAERASDAMAQHVRGRDALGDRLERGGL